VNTAPNDSFSKALSAVRAAREQVAKLAFVPLPPDQPAPPQQAMPMDPSMAGGGMAPGMMQGDPAAMPPGDPMAAQAGGVPPGMAPMMPQGAPPAEPMPQEDLGPVIEQIMQAMQAVDETLRQFAQEHSQLAQQVEQLGQQMQQIVQQHEMLMEAIKEPSPMDGSVQQPM